MEEEYEAPRKSWQAILDEVAEGKQVTTLEARYLRDKIYFELGELKRQRDDLSRDLCRD